MLKEGKAKKKEVFTDKGYKVPKNDEYLEQEKIKNRIQHKAYRNRPLTYWQVQFKKLISKQRYKVEKTFGGMKRWFGSGWESGCQHEHCYLISIKYLSVEKDTFFWW